MAKDVYGCLLLYTKCLSSFPQLDLIKKSQEKRCKRDVWLRMQKSNKHAAAPSYYVFQLKITIIEEKLLPYLTTGWQNTKRIRCKL